MVQEGDGAGGAKQVILVVEDTRPIADLICQVLNEQPDYEAISVGNGAAALETLQGIQARLLILDVTLPGISGLELYEHLQAEEKTRAVPVVFVTADQAALGRLRERGMPYVLQKPFDLDRLLQVVAAALDAAQ